MRASRRRPLSRTAPRMSSEPNPASPVLRRPTWKLRNPGPRSGGQTAVLLPVVPAGRPATSKDAGCARTRLRPPPSGSPDPGLGRAVPGPACQGLRCELRRDRCGARGEGAPAFTSPHPSPAGKREYRPPQPCFPLLRTPGARPGPPQGSQSKNLLAFFVPMFESPLAPPRGLEPVLPFLAPPLPAWGAEEERQLPSSHR